MKNNNSINIIHARLVVITYWAVNTPKIPNKNPRRMFTRIPKDTDKTKTSVFFMLLKSLCNTLRKKNPPRKKKAAAIISFPTE